MGCVPLFPDIDQVPKFSMIHYPKTALKDIYLEVSAGNSRPTSSILEYLKSHFNRHLTSLAMAEYISARAGIKAGMKVAFLDLQAPRRPDYLSVLTYIGLKQLFKRDCSAIIPIPYVFKDWPGDTVHLYGRGFGYTKVLDPSLRAKRRLSLRYRRLKDFDKVVVGSVSRNGPLANRLLKTHGGDRLVLLHGEDQPPSPRELWYLQQTGATSFVRSLPD